MKISTQKAQPKQTQPSPYLTWAIPLALVAITAITYYPSLHYAFQFDDEPNIVKFYPIRYKTLSDLFFTSTRWIGHWINTIHFKLGQFEPFVYRRTNVAFHCLTGFFLFFILLFLLRRRPKTSWAHQYATVLASITSALFLLHPVQTQTVSYVVQGQLEGLSAFFCLLIIASFLLLTQCTKMWQKILACVLTFFICVLACGTKEVTIIVPALVFLIDWFFIAQGSWHEIKSRWWAHALIASTVFGCYVWLLGKNFILNILLLKIKHQNNIGNILTQSAAQKITPGAFFISQFKVVVHYLFMFLWPNTISVDYDWKLCSGFDCADCILPFLLLTGIFISVYLALKKNKTSLYAFGMLWFFICLSPRSTIMPSTELIADYKTYLASVGWLLVIASALVLFFEWAAKKWPALRHRVALVICALVGIITLSTLTYARNKVWQSGLSFWNDIVLKAPNKARGYNNYGGYLIKIKHDYEQAVWYFKRAIAIEPDTYPDPYNNISAAYALLHRIDDAILAVHKSLQINPAQPKAYNNLGIYLMQREEFDLAHKAFTQAINIYPPYGLAHFNLGRLAIKQGKKEIAWQHFKDACTKADYDTCPAGLHAYGQVSCELGKYEDAIHAYTMALKVDPNDEQARSQKEWCCERCKINRMCYDRINCLKR